MSTDGTSPKNNQPLDLKDLVCVPNEVYDRFFPWCRNDRIGLLSMRFVSRLVSLTFKGLTEKEAEMRRFQGRAWFPLTIPQVAAIITGSEAEAVKVLDHLEFDARVLLCRHERDRVLYAIDYDRIRKLKPGWGTGTGEVVN